MGLWHGAEWKYVLWGLIQALIIIFFRFINKIKILNQKKIFNFIKGFITLQLIMISWIPFRADNISDAILMYNKLFDLSSWFNLSLKENTYLVIFIVTSGYFIMPFFLKFINKFIKKKCIKWTLEVSILFLLITAIFAFFDKVNEFIYFQF
jgi:D-alanyl-lipoteichoic acid acyltransferase DltB (MBOAT superfamily)